MADSRLCEGGEAHVSLISKEMVVPAKPTERQSYFLSCFDIFWRTNHYNQRVIFYESTKGVMSGQEGGWDGRAVMEELKSSLARCLVHYYPWCGRISAGDRLFIDCNDAGVEFVEASLDLPISRLSLQGFQVKPFFQHLCQTVDPSGDSLYSTPLLSIQATLFSDGGLALGISQSHVVADGQSLWNFMVSWGECARGLPLSLPPVLDRRILALPNPSPEKATWDLNTTIKEEDIQEEEQNVQKNGVSAGTNSSSEDNKEAAQTASEGTAAPAEGERVGTETEGPKRTSCVFHLPASAVKELKMEDGGVHTSYEVTCAHLWQRLTAARERPSWEPSFFFVLANCRARMTPPLPPAYFGNSIGFGITVSTSGKICSESLHATASRIHDIVVEIVQEASIVGFMHWLEVHDHDLKSAIFPKIPKGKGVNVASSPRFPVYEVDFGWGKPSAVRSPKVPGEGELVLFGGHPKFGPGDVEICARLPDDVLKRLLEDPKFLGKPPCNPFEDH